jgi:hypothetical protein
MMVIIRTMDFPDGTRRGTMEDAVDIAPAPLTSASAREGSRRSAVDWNAHCVVFMVRDRLAEARADAARRARVPRRPARRLRQRAGEALIRLGRRLATDGVALEISRSASRG